jgi:arginine repressor
MEVMIAVQSGTLLRALSVLLKRRVSARRGGGYYEVPQATQKKSRSSPSNYVTPFAYKLLSKQGFG